MNWGKGIAVFLVTFIAFILYLVISVSSVSVDLEYSDYYDQELSFEQQIIAARNHQSLDRKVTVSTDSVSVIIHFENIKQPERIHGKVHFFRPSNASQDRVYDLWETVDSNGQVSYPINQMTPGKYIVQITYIIDGESHFTKQQIWV